MIIPFDTIYYLCSSSFQNSANNLSNSKAHIWKLELLPKERKWESKEIRKIAIPFPSDRSFCDSMPSASTSGLRSNVRVVVVGDRATGKSSLIAAAATETFPDEVPPVLPPTRLPADYYPHNIPVTIIDTSSRFIHTLLLLSPCSGGVSWNLVLVSILD